MPVAPVEAMREAVTDIEELPALVERCVGSAGKVRGPLLPVLHAIQHEIGWIPDAAIPLIAYALNLSRAEVHGVVSFYHDFRSRPPARHVVKFCRAEACQARGGDDVEAKLAARLGEAVVHGRVAIEPVYCLGLCATGPNALVDDRPLSRIDARAIERIALQVAP